MPFKSKKQETYLRINEPEIHKRWVDAYGHYAAESFDDDVYCWRCSQVSVSNPKLNYRRPVVCVCGVCEDCEHAVDCPIIKTASFAAEETAWYSRHGMRIKGFPEPYYRKMGYVVEHPDRGPEKLYEIRPTLLRHRTHRWEDVEGYFIPWWYWIDEEEEPQTGGKSFYTLDEALLWLKANPDLVPGLEWEQGHAENYEAESFSAEVGMCKTCGEHEESGYCESCDSCYGICECDDCDCYTCKGAESFSAESKVYQIPCFWSVSMTIPVEAESLDEACEKAYTEIEKHDMSKADYLEDSFEPDYWFARDLNEEDEE